MLRFLKPALRLACSTCIWFGKERYSWSWLVNVIGYYLCYRQVLVSRMFERGNLIRCCTYDPQGAYIGKSSYFSQPFVYWWLLNKYFSKQWRPRWNVTLSGISSRSTLFAMTKNDLQRKKKNLFGNYNLWPLDIFNEPFQVYLRNRSAPAVNCWVIIHCLEVSCIEDQITSAQREWFIFVQLTDKQWIITQQFTH